MKTRSLHTRIWHDSWFEKLSLVEKLLFLYLLTNEYINLPGVYELSDRRILIETGLSQTQLDKAKVAINPKIIFYKDWVIIKNIDRYDNYSGGKLLKAKKVQLSEIPLDIQDKALEFRNTLSIGYRYSMDTPNSNSNSNKKEIVKEKTNNKDLQDFINHWNTVFDTKFKSSDHLIDNFSYWTKNYSLDEIKTAVSKISSHPFWKDKMTPERLLRRKNPRGEAVDYIGELLNLKQSKEKDTRNMSERMIAAMEENNLTQI